jgi:hypothetical protein
VTNTVSVTGPGNQSGVSGTAISPLHITATDSGSSPLTYSDGGSLPPGLAIGSGTGTVTGTPTTAGTYPVTITATDGAGYSGSTSFTWTIANAPGTPTVLSLNRTSGPAAGGTVVKITGTNLTGVTSVMFGSHAVTRLRWNRKGTKLIVTTPTEVAGTVDVIVVTSHGSSSPTPADRYTFVAPTVTGVSPNSGPAAGGGKKIKVSGTDFQGATKVVFGTVQATFSINAKGTAITVTVPAGSPGTVDVVVTSPGGSSAVTAADEYTYTG